MTTSSFFKHAALLIADVEALLRLQAECDPELLEHLQDARDSAAHYPTTDPLDQALRELLQQAGALYASRTRLAGGHMSSRMESAVQSVTTVYPGDQEKQMGTSH